MFWDSYPPSTAYMRQWIGSALVQIMTCRLFGAKPLSKPMLDYCQLEHRNKIRWYFNQNTKCFIHENASQKYRLRNGSHFVDGEGELMTIGVGRTDLLQFTDKYHVTHACWNITSGTPLLSKINWAWIINRTHCILWEVINHTGYNFNGGSTKLSWKLGHVYDDTPQCCWAACQIPQICRSDSLHDLMIKRLIGYWNVPR